MPPPPPPLPPLPPPLPSISVPLSVRRDDSSDTDFSKKIKSAKNKTTKSKLSKKEESQMDRVRFEQLDMEKEIQMKMNDILRKKKEQKSVRWQNSSELSCSDSDEDRRTKKRKKVEKPLKKRKDKTTENDKPVKPKKMTRKEYKAEMKRLEEERLQKLRNVDPDAEVEKRMRDLLQKDTNILSPIVKEDLRVSTVWTTDKARQLDHEKERLDRELEKFDREREMERKMSEILTRKDPWKPEARPSEPGTKPLSPKLTGVQGRVREAILRQEREAQEKIQMERDRRERAERRRIIQERERLVREQKELERMEREKIEKELREQREREIRAMIRKEVEAELRRIPRPRQPGCASNQCRNLMHCCIEIAGNSPIEGCPGLVDRNNTIFEKVFYVTTVFFSLYACFDMLYETYTKWSTAPFLTVAEENPTAVWKIPFPAVTVCSELKIRHTVLEYGTYFDDIGDVLEREIPRDLFQKLLVSSTVCELPRNEGDEFMNEEDLDILAEVLPQMASTITSCKWRGTVEDCSAFTSMFKEEGVCFNFNMLDREDVFREEVIFYDDFMLHGKKPLGWTLAGGYPKEQDTDTFPRRDRPSLPYPPVTHEDYNAGLVLSLEINTEDYDPVCSKEEGWRIYFHHPVEVPGIHSQYIKIEPNKEVTISIDPSSTSMEKLKKFPPEKRNCYYPEERNLTYYRTYTQLNCEMECLVNMTINYCECATFYMPRTNNTDLCVERTIEYNRVFREAFLQNEEATEKFILDELGTHSKYFNVAIENITDPLCSCRPTCNFINYKLEIAQENFNANETEELDPEVQTTQTARIVIRYKDKAFVPADKLEMFSITDFIAAVGAVLGTFLGISFGKALEMVYINFIKVLRNIKNYGIGNWAGPMNEE